MKFRTFPVESVSPLSSSDLAGLTQLRRQIQNQSQVRSETSGCRLVPGPDQRRIEPSTGHLVRFGRQRIPIR
jgi:hypothetical protein